MKKCFPRSNISHVDCPQAKSWRDVFISVLSASPTVDLNVPIPIRVTIFCQIRGCSTPMHVRACPKFYATHLQDECTLHRSFNKKPPALSPTGVVPDSPNYQAKVKPIKPASHCIQRKRNFQPKPSRFCLLNGHRNSVVVAVS
ncbi:hypothetical protein J1N35_035459 [Gossypium stocksii]|uniref:Uncharacterized protein n=1 Tax=Gossypium stocksii TaxID=47602 RepID=A0A9D3UVR0_9ROSI|nr:hypothetical protein J1N35_035459 [Gossypium stocksii]